MIVSLLFISISLFGIDSKDFIRYKKGDTVKEDCIATSIDTHNELLSIYNAYNFILNTSGTTSSVLIKKQTSMILSYIALTTNLKAQLSIKNEILENKDREIEKWSSKYEWEKQFRIELQKDMQTYVKQMNMNLVLKTSHGIAWSIAVAEIIGIGVFSILQYTMNK